MAGLPNAKIFDGIMCRDFTAPDKAYLCSKSSDIMLPVLIVSIALVIIAFALFSVRLLFLKKGEFRGTCATNNPMLQKEGAVCGVCGRKPGEACGKEEAS